MVEVVTLDEFRNHLNVEPDEEAGDLLQTYLAAAVRAIENRVDRSFEAGDNAISEADLPAAKQAVLLLAGHWFRNREAVLVGVAAVDLPMAVEFLITPFARLRV